MLSTGDTYRATVPDTLDLAERAKLAVNAIIGSADAEKNYETILSAHFDHRTPYMSHQSAGPCHPKPIQALAMMRVASGSTQDANVDGKMLDVLVSDIDDVGGLWWMNTEGRPWRADTYKVDQVWAQPNGRLMEALMCLYQVDRNPRWLELRGRIAGGLAKIAQHNQDRAWFKRAYTRSATGRVEITREQEPERAPQYDVGVPLRGLVSWYAVSGDEQRRSSLPMRWPGSS